jgi:hypothetical protein
MRLKKEIYKREINKREINKKEINKKKIYKKNIYKKDEKIIKKIIAVFIFLFSLNLSIKSVGAKTGALGFFGGISQGWRLPKTTETITGSARKKNNEALVYKEIIFLSGEPTEFEGLMTVKNGEATENFGSYDVSFVVRPNGNNDATVDRNITFNVNYRKEGTQTVKDFSASSWSETITIDGENYVLDPAASNFGVSVLEDAAPGVSYYKGAV